MTIQEYIFMKYIDLDLLKLISGIIEPLPEFRYSPDQPRDDHGRFTAVGGSGDSGLTESTNSDIIGLETSNGIRITSLSEHAAMRLKDPKRECTPQDIHDAVVNPIHIGDTKTDSFGRKSQRFIGKIATININPDTGIITTVWKTGKRYRNKYSKE